MYQIALKKLLRGSEGGLDELRWGAIKIQAKSL